MELNTILKEKFLNYSKCLLIHQGISSSVVTVYKFYTYYLSMTLSIMENHDAIKTALKDYQTNSGEIPKVLERYLEYVARTGKPLFSWDLISCLVMKKFENVLDDFVQEKPVQTIKNANSDNLSVQDLKQECILALNNLTGVPFTIQRLCELLLSPKKNYSKLEKFLRGFLRVIKVVTTVDRVGQKITTESQLFANAMSPFHVNESGDNWSGFSSQADESLSKIQFHNEEINSLSDNKHDSLEYTTDEQLGGSGSPCPATDSMTSYPGSLKSVVVLVEQHQPTVMTASAVSSCSSSLSACQPETASQQQSQYFIDQTNQKPTISMPPIGALFKPIDQLEAFVQTVSNHQPQQQVDSSTPIASTSCHEQQENIASGVETTTFSPSKKRPIGTLDDSVITIDAQNPLDGSEVDNDDIGITFESITYGSTTPGRTGLSSPAKKRRLERSQHQAQEAVISSSCASSTAAAAIATAATLVVLVEDAAMMVGTGDLEMSCGGPRDDDVTEQAGPSTECCSEEPSSSTNELLNTVIDNQVQEQQSNSLAGVSPSTVQLRDAASNSQGSNTVVEAADQSNCAEDEEESGEVSLTRAITEPEAMNSIDEETGEHV